VSLLREGKPPVLNRRTHLNKNYPKGQALATVLPSIELLERSREIVEDAVVQIGRLTLETILAMSAMEVAGEPRRGKEKGEIRHHGSQRGRLVVGGKRIQVDKPRLRTKDGKEVAVPAYETLKRDPATSQRALNRVLRGISTRDYAGVFDEAGEEVGVSKSNVSRDAREAAEAALKDLVDRKIQARQLAVYVDGVHLGESVAIVAVGVCETGVKRVLGLTEGATENSASAGALLDSMIQRGMDEKLPTLFVIDGSKALRKAIKEKFPNAFVQRCRIHKLRNVLDQLPLAKRRYVKAKIQLAYTLPFEEATAKLEGIAKELEILHPGAAASLREGFEESLTVTRWNLAKGLTSSLSSTNLIETSFSRARSKLSKITHFSSGEMAMRWCGSAMALAEQGFRAIRGFKDLWTLRAALDNITLAEAK
jgi:transposase-like protein